MWFTTVLYLVGVDSLPLMCSLSYVARSLSSTTSPGGMFWLWSWLLYWLGCVVSSIWLYWLSVCAYDSAFILYKHFPLDFLLYSLISVFCFRRELFLHASKKSFWVIHTSLLGYTYLIANLPDSSYRIIHLHTIIWFNQTPIKKNKTKTIFYNATEELRIFLTIANNYENKNKISHNVKLWCVKDIGYINVEEKTWTGMRKTMYMPSSKF